MKNGAWRESSSLGLFSGDAALEDVAVGEAVADEQKGNENVGKVAGEHHGGVWGGVWAEEVDVENGGGGGDD